MAYLKRDPKNEMEVLRPFSHLRCPMVGHDVKSCRQLCVPMEGVGLCGRPATHLMKNRAQQALAVYQSIAVFCELRAKHRS